MVPTVALPPAVPFTDQVTAVLSVPVTVAVNCTGVPTGVSVSVGATATVAFTAGAVIVTMAAPKGLVSAELMAFTVIVAGLGTVAGAVYNPEVLMVPTVEFPPSMPFTAQVMVVLVELTTLAENCSGAPVRRVAEAGEMVTIGKGTLGRVLLEPQLARNITLAIDRRRPAAAAGETF